ncbi:hypothetical protein A2V95_00110 [Candidatus Kuenenbacteria bacterium RBG_16_41_7]|uniref:Type II toxin-antitoxin system HicA family toxin n=1 Tax=Candidatus Kuenenbacteria bacterium RBG_16_41_7 TaxID=1798560 RepID=A0A1F6GCM1_9BACT|nr:MAG: hypothetical protein A2V95_00110 [Candidatus Kuenenbacteria bacterium RBG_16_41_7]
MFNDVKTQKMYEALRKLKGISIEVGGKENMKIVCLSNHNKYPLPVKHPKIKQAMVEKFAKWLEQNNICLRDEFRALL